MLPIRENSRPMEAANDRRDQIVYTTVKGFTLYQQNGQRTYGGPPPNWGSRPPPSRESEVFIGRLPRMCFEDELIPLFLTAGELYEFRLMLDFSGTNRGYGYAHYATLEGAQRAIEKLNKYELRPGHRIGVLKSKNNCRLLFGNIGAALDVDSFDEFIRTTTEQVLNVLMFRNFRQLRKTEYRISPDIEEAFLNRVPRGNASNQFAIVEYENHKAAAVARRILIPKYGHILAIDWAVPPRERRRSTTIYQQSEPQSSAVERPLPQPSAPECGSPVRWNSKTRPVPVLMTQPSPLDNVPFNQKAFSTVVKFFKYHLSVCLYKSVDQLEIPLTICKEIEKKIVNRITNLENCSEAVQLIFNFFSWCSDKKGFLVNAEVQKCLHEIKIYSERFVYFVNKNLSQAPLENTEDHFYIYILPLQLIVLFRIMMCSYADYLDKFSSGITASLSWLLEVLQKEEKRPEDVIFRIVSVVINEEGVPLEKICTAPRSLFVENEENASKAPAEPSASNPIRDLMPLQRFVGTPGQIVPMHASPTKTLQEESDSRPYPSVPLLLIQPSIMNKIPFMPGYFNSLPKFFRHLIKVCVYVNTWKLNMPQQTFHEMERKIIDRISNMENCVQAIEMVFSYFSSWMAKHPSCLEMETFHLLLEIKRYAEDFVSFVWKKATTVFVFNEALETLYCRAMPLRLNLLFQMMKMFNNENPMRLLTSITKGLNWLDQFIVKGDPASKQFIKDLVLFVESRDLGAGERAKVSGKRFCSDLMHECAHPLVYPGLPLFGTVESLNFD